MKLPREVAGFDSATGMLVALASHLHGRSTPPLGNPAFRALRPVAAAVARLPVGLRQHIYSVFSGSEGRPPAEIARLDLNAISAAITEVYPRRRYPAVFVGSSNGALTHLCAALGVPWLPQTLLLPVRQKALPPDEPARARHAFDDAARALLGRHPDVVLHHMHDPNQDRLTLRRMAYFRVKRTRLGDAYERFLAEVLEPGGTIVVVDCRQRWPVTRIGERHVFQFGAPGGLTAQDYRNGRWPAPLPDGDAPEAEWGFEPGLAADVDAFARRHGYRVARLAFDSPDDLSPLVADVYRSWYRRLGRPAGRLLVDSFMLIDPYETLRAGAVPFWSFFPVQSSVAAVHRYLDTAEPYTDIHLGLFCHGVRSAGMATADQWRDVLRRATRSGTFTGVSPRRYPADPRTFFEFPAALRALAGRSSPPAEPLPMNELRGLLQRP